MALLHIDHHGERLEVGQRWVELTEAGHRDSIGQALIWRLYDLIERGGVDDMAAIPGVREPLAELVDKLRQPLHRHFLTCFDAKWLIMLGRFAEAEQTAREGYKYGRVAQGSHVGLLYAGQRFAVRRDQGRLRELFAEVVAFLDPDNPPIPIWRAGLIVARHEAGDPRRAEAELRDMIRDRGARVPRDMFWLGTMCLLAESAAMLGDQPAAADILPLPRAAAGSMRKSGWPRYSDRWRRSSAASPDYSRTIRPPANTSRRPSNAARSSELARLRRGFNATTVIPRLSRRVGGRTIVPASSSVGPTDRSELGMGDSCSSGPTAPPAAHRRQPARHMPAAVLGSVVNASSSRGYLTPDPLTQLTQALHDLGTPCELILPNGELVSFGGRNPAFDSFCATSSRCGPPRFLPRSCLRRRGHRCRRRPDVSTRSP